MKNTLSSIVRWAGRAAIAAAFLPLTLHAAIFDATSLSVVDHETYTTGDIILFVMELDLDDATCALDPASIPADFGLRFRLSDDSERVATFLSADQNLMSFQYTVQESDYSVGLKCVSGSQFVGTLSQLKNMAGTSVGFYVQRIRPQPVGSMLPLEDDEDNTAIKINPTNASIFTINFLDEYGEKWAANKSFPLEEGQEAVQYVINVGSKPVTPLTVYVNWGVSNVFGNTSVTTNLVEDAQQTFTIDRILDDGANPASTGEHPYTITAVSEEENSRSSSMLATVKNVRPEITGFFGSVGLTTNTALAVDQEISVTVQVEDVAGELDDPLSVTWRFGSRTPTVTTQWMGTYWESTAVGTIPEGYSTISVTVYDKDRGAASTNALIYAEAGPLLLATIAETPTEGLNNLGDGTIEIVQPGSGSIAWDPDYGNHLPSTATRAILRANAFDAATSDDQYDSYYYKWYNKEDIGLEAADHTRGLKSGYDPISRDATVNLLADDSAPAADRAPMDRVIQYYFSRELYRPDNFGDIDGDRLGDEWEIRWFAQSAKNFTDPVSGEFVKPAESGAPVRADGATLLYDFSGSGNMDGDGLPANCFAIHDYTVDADITRADGTVLLPAGTYSVQSFAYPLSAATIASYGYLPLGGTHMVSYDEEADIAAFRACTYVDQGALKTILVDFNNELEFRGVGLFQGVVDEAGETISFRPRGDGDEPNTDPMSSDTDGDGLPDGWEYYFWAVAYYNIGSDQWVRFNGATPSGGSYQGTGDPISRDDILNTFNPTSAAFIDADIDNDGLSNMEEFALGTNPIHWDTDGDGLPDGWEIDRGMMSVFSGGAGWCDMNGNQYESDNTSMIHPWNAQPHSIANGTLVTTEDGRNYIMILNPLNGNDSDFFEDYDYYAAAGNLCHYDVFLAYDFDPRTGWVVWANPQVTYAGNTFAVENPNTEIFTALDEFNVGAWYVEHGVIGELTPGNWNNYTTDPCFSDSDYDAIPDGWELYVAGLDGGLAPKEGATDRDEDRLNNVQEFLCTDATNVYWYTFGEADFMPSEDLAYRGIRELIEEWPNKPWPTNPNPTIGPGYAHGGDTDNDQILDYYEKEPNCNPTCCDTDHDYLPDLWECYYGTDPLVRDTFMDYDGDGLQNWQEYLTGAVWAWQYDKWYDTFGGTAGPGYGEVDMWDFFVDPDNVATYMGPTSNRYGGFGRAAHSWDCASGAEARQNGTGGSGAPFFFLSAEVDKGSGSPKLVAPAGLDNFGYTALGTYEERTEGSVGFATTDPWSTDSDNDGMDDFYEIFHGLNPLYGGAAGDIVGKISDYPDQPWDLVSFPWLSGDPNADPDKDGLASREESANYYVSGGIHHTDPSPYWLTDPFYERSVVNLYYQPGAVFDSSDPVYWYFGIDGGGGDPRYAFSFETNEGYDTDNDNVGDRSELTTDELLSKADPLDSDNPRRRKAMYFNGVDAACRTRKSYTTNDPDEFRTFTVEAWICPVNPASGRVQTIIERSTIVPQDTAKGETEGKRINFRLSIEGNGALRGEFHNYQGAHVTMETEAASTGLRAGVWSHVAMTYSGTPAQTGYLTIYVNGRHKKSVASNLQAFNGYLQDASVSYNISDTETSSSTTYEAYGCAIVLGASDERPNGVINGHQSYAYGGVVDPDLEPQLTDYFQGWMDEVRIWDGARSVEGILATKDSRFSIADVRNWLDATDKIANRPVALRHHYTFDNLPDTVPSASRAADAYIFPSDVETLPTGLGEVFTAPNDGSYPGIPWWNASAYVNYRYDTRHIQWIEDSVIHIGNGEVVDAPRIVAVTDEDDNIVGYREYVYNPTFNSSTNRTVIRYDGELYPVDNLPNVYNPYGNGYNAVQYGENLVVTLTGNTVTNGNATVTNGMLVAYDGYDTGEGSPEGDSDWWYADLLPLGGAVADIDVALWDGQGVGYELVTVDTDGDGIPDYWETLYGLDPFDANDAWADSDGDGLDNVAEFLSGTSPFSSDSDGDGYPDYYDRDTDKSLTYGELHDDYDGMPSWWEVAYGTDPRVYDADEDPDGDGWSNYSEYLGGSDPNHATDHPVPPVLFNVEYDGTVNYGNGSDASIVVYAYSNSTMDGRPDAVYVQEIHPKDEGYLDVNDEYLATIQEGKYVYSGKLAMANINNAARSFAIDFYSDGKFRYDSLSMANEAVAFNGAFDDAPQYYCDVCDETYSRSQMIKDGATVLYCPHNHFRVPHLTAVAGGGSEMSSGDGDGAARATIDYVTGEWTVTIPGDGFVGVAIVATYQALPSPVFPFSMRRKWTTDLENVEDYTRVFSGHLREGATRFFAFIDRDGDFLFDTDEPAGMALYQPVSVGVGPVEVDIPLTDFLTGFPRFSWEPVEGAEGYSIRLGLTGDATLNGYVLDAGRTFLMEQDLLAYGGVNLGSSQTALLNWDVRPVFSDSATVPGDAIASGVLTNSVASSTRKSLSILSPSEASTVSDATFTLKWKMDYRNEGVKILLKNTDTGVTRINKTFYLPRRVGALTDDYFYVCEPQKIFGSSVCLDVPDGNYTLTVTENIRSSAVTPQSATVHFKVDHSGNLEANPKAEPLGKISGTLTYYGKVPFTIENEVLGTFDGVTTEMVAPLSKSPGPGTLSVKLVSNGKTLFTASDTGGLEGMPSQGLYSAAGDVLLTGSVSYGDNPSVSVLFASAPAAGVQLVASYKQYTTPIRIQAFKVNDEPLDVHGFDVDSGASFSGIPAAQTTVFSKGAFTFDGLPMGTYCLRAFIDQDRDCALDPWESVGYAMNVVRKTIAIENFATFAVPPGADNVEITISDKDTDSDRLPDSWEYYYYSNIATQGGYTENKVGVYLWQEYADGELDSNPLVEDTDGDGLPDAVEHLLGSSNERFDTDFDGVGDLEEFLAGSDPVKASSTSRFTAPAPTFLPDGTPALELETPALIPGLYIRYTLLAKDALDAPWAEVGSSDLIGVYKTEPVGVPRGTVTIPDPEGADSAFYKVKVSFESDTILDR